MHRQRADASFYPKGLSIPSGQRGQIFILQFEAGNVGRAHIKTAVGKDFRRFRRVPAFGSAGSGGGRNRVGRPDFFAERPHVKTVVPETISEACPDTAISEIQNQEQATAGTAIGRTRAERVREIASQGPVGFIRPPYRCRTTASCVRKGHRGTKRRRRAPRKPGSAFRRGGRRGIVRSSRFCRRARSAPRGARLARSDRRYAG